LRINIKKLHGKNGFVAVSKNLARYKFEIIFIARYRLKIIFCLDHQNNDVRHSNWLLEY